MGMHTSTSAKVYLGTLLYLSFHKIQNVHGTGQFVINLLSYSFEYEAMRGDDGRNGSAQVSSVTFSSEMAYKPLWKLNTGIDQQDHPMNGNSTTATTDWPWTTKTECSPPSQYRFLICLDYDNSYVPENPCSLERIQTDQINLDRSPFPPAILGRETISFSSVLTNRDNRNIIRNPLTVNFPSWKGPVRISVYIKCCGELAMFKGQCNEVLATTFTRTPISFIQGTQTIWTTLYGRGSLLLTASATCDPSFFGPSCEIQCQVLNPTQEHAFCNASTGTRQCLKGWSGSDCQTDVNECLEIKCQNGGTCRNQPGSFTCNCPLGTAATYCEQRVAICHLRPCRNQGTCLDTPSGSLCLCTPGYTGEWCDVLETTQSETVTTTIVPVVNTTARGSLGRGEADTVGGGSGSTQNINSWKDWYLAIILGMALVLILVVGAIIYRAKGKQRYKINETLDQEPPTELSPSKSRQFNNATYQASDPSNIIHSNHIIHPNQSLAFNSNDFHVDYCNLRNEIFHDLDTSGLRPEAPSGGGYSNKGFSDDVSEPLRMENPAFNHGYGKNVNMDQEQFPPLDRRDSVDVSADHLKDQSSNFASSHQFVHNHFINDTRRSPIQQSIIPASPKPVAVIMGVKNLETNLLPRKLVSTQGSGDVFYGRLPKNSNIPQNSRVPHDSDVSRNNRLPQNSNLLEKSRILQSGSTFGEERGSDRKESIYEEVNTELTKKPLKPVPLPRSVYKVRSETLKRKLYNIADGADKHGVYCNVQGVAGARPIQYNDEDGYCIPVITRRKSDGCLADVQPDEISHQESPSRYEAGANNPRDTVYMTCSPEMGRHHLHSPPDEYLTPCVTSVRPRPSDLRIVYSASECDLNSLRPLNKNKSSDNIYCNVGQVSLTTSHEHDPLHTAEDCGKGETSQQKNIEENDFGYVNSAAVASYLKL